MAPLSTTSGNNHDIMDEINTLHGIRYKKKLPMLRLKKSLHPHVFKDAVEDEEEENINDAELTSPFGSMLSRSTRIWNNNELSSSTKGDLSITIGLKLMALSCDLMLEANYLFS